MKELTSLYIILLRAGEQSRESVRFSSADHFTSYPWTNAVDRLPENQGIFNPREFGLVNQVTDSS